MPYEKAEMQIIEIQSEAFCWWHSGLKGGGDGRDTKGSTDVWKEGMD